MAKRCINCDYTLNDSDNICPSCGQNQNGDQLNFDFAWENKRKKAVAGAAIAAVAIVAFVGIRIALYKWSSKQPDSPVIQPAKVTATSNDYEVSIYDKWIEESDGKYTLVVSYDYNNNSGKPQNFVWACQDKVFLDGIECSMSYDDYSGTDTSYLTYAKRSDDIVSGKSVIVNVGYEMPKFNPDKEQELTIRITKALDTSEVKSEKSFKTSDIKIVRGDE